MRLTLAHLPAHRAGLLLTALLAVVSCSSATDPNPSPPAPTVDLTGYFVLPSAGFQKFYTGGFSQAWSQDTTVNGTLSADLEDNAGLHEYLATADRAWVATLDTAAGGTLYLLSPPLAALPDKMPASGSHVGNSGFVTTTGTIPVRRISRLMDTGLVDTVPAGIFDSVALVRQEFWVFTKNGLGIPDTLVDSAFRWFAPGVDEIRRVLWRDGDVDSTLREFVGGTVGGNSYP